MQGFEGFTGFLMADLWLWDTPTELTVCLFIDYFATLKGRI
jgi:hypothetical protein